MSGSLHLEFEYILQSSGFESCSRIHEFDLNANEYLRIRPIDLCIILQDV